MTGAEFLSAELARLSFLDGYEAGIEGMRACAFIIRNRVRAGWGSWNDVLTQHQKWSWRSVVPNYYQIPDPRVYSFQTLLRDIDRIFSGEQEDTVTIAADPIKNYVSVGPSPAPALYYARLNDISNPWFEQNICGHADTHKLIANVQPLSFFT